LQQRLAIALSLQNAIAPLLCLENLMLAISYAGAVGNRAFPNKRSPIL
jgi:hypothetical protein